jgi:NADH-quinone oxidoreductase subunit K
VIGLGHYLVLSAVLFGIGAIGFLTRRNVLIQLMFAFFVIAVAAAEAAVGLALVISLYRLKQTVYTDEANLLKH